LGAIGDFRVEETGKLLSNKYVLNRVSGWRGDFRDL
jgi:hypothetical protein